MSGRSSPMNGGCEAARLTVRKDLFPDVRLPKLASDDNSSAEEDETISCVNLETDFEKSIDEIAIQRQKLMLNGIMSSPARTRHKKHKSKRDVECPPVNGCLSSDTKRKKRSRHRTRTKTRADVLQVISGKNLNLVSSSAYQANNYVDEDAGPDEVEEEDKQAQSSSDEELIPSRVKLPLIKPRHSGKPYSHQLSQLSTKKKRKEKEKLSHVIVPCSGKPRSMVDICSRSKKKSKKSESVPTYRSQIVDTHTMKIKIRRTSVHETATPAPVSISDIGQRSSKKKRAASPAASNSSGEEYDPSRGDSAAAMSVAAPKSKQPRTRTRKTNNKSNNTKSKDKSEKTERNRVSAAESQDAGPQSLWGGAMPAEILLKIFEYVTASQGSLPSVIRLGRVCKLWHSVSCRPELWKNVDLTQYTTEKCKTDYKLVWLLENRLSQCQSLNIGQWKVCNVSWVLACVADYCPSLVELSVAGWSRITPDQLYDLLHTLPSLQRLDLSLTSETGGSSTCLSVASMARVTESFGERLTHLTLANNKFTALTQILTSVATHCKNLEVLDISGALATSHPAAVPLEALQKGCPKMRVFRAANSQLVLASATTSQQMEVEGWVALEELSIAGVATTKVGEYTLGEYKLGDEALARLVRGATRLRLLDLRGLQRLTDSGLVRVPAWDLHHLFLGGCNVTRQNSACLELICQKWSHSLIELDLSWASAAKVLDAAVMTLAESTTSKLRTLNLCGSSVSLEPVRQVLLKCAQVESINLSSCRALPRGMKRLFVGRELQDLKDSFDPKKVKAKEEEAATSKAKSKKGKDAKKTEADSKSDAKESSTDTVETADTKKEAKSQDETSSFLFQEPKRVVSSGPVVSDKNTSASDSLIKASPDSKSAELSTSNEDTRVPTPEGKRSSRDATPKLLSPFSQSRPDSSSTPRSEPKLDHSSPHFSPVSKPDSQVQNSPDVQPEPIKSNSWNLANYKTTPTHKSEASPINKIDNKLKHGKVVEQCSPTTSHENKRSPETLKQDIKNLNNWNYGNYSPMPRQDGQFSSQRSPYSAQPSPAQPSPYSTQPSPYSAQPSPYSSQPSPYSAQPSPDTSQIIKPEIQKTSAWNTGNYSPMPKHHQPFSPHPSTHTSPDPGVGIKGTPNRTPGQYSPMSRQDRIHQSPYSPRPSVDNVAYTNKKSPGIGNYSPMMRPDCHLPSPDAGVGSRPALSGRGQQDMFGRPISKVPDILQSGSSLPDMSNQFSFGSMGASSGLEQLGWGVPYSAEQPAPPAPDALGAVLTTPPPQPHWPPLPPFGNSAKRRLAADLTNPWTIGQYREEVHNTFVEQNVSFESLRSHVGHAHGSTHHSLPSYLEDGFTEPSRVD